MIDHTGHSMEVEISHRLLLKSRQAFEPNDPSTALIDTFENINKKKKSLDINDDTPLKKERHDFEESMKIKSPHDDECIKGTAYFSIIKNLISKAFEFIDLGIILLFALLDYNSLLFNYNRWNENGHSPRQS